MDTELKRLSLEDKMVGSWQTKRRLFLRLQGLQEKNDERFVESQEESLRCYRKHLKKVGKVKR